MYRIGRFVFQRQMRSLVVIDLRRLVHHPDGIKILGTMQR
jgi:hypothetical protein